MLKNIKSLLGNYLVAIYTYIYVLLKYAVLKEHSLVDVS